MSTRFSFTESELDALRQAVTNAERGTPGEIVVFVSPRSGSYEEVFWRGAGAGLMVGVLVWALASMFAQGWGITVIWHPLFATGVICGFAVFGTVITRLSGSVFRLLAGRMLLESTVRTRAQTVFLREGVAETAARTGILLFLSELERRLEILADKGINAVVDQDRWQGIVGLVGEGLSRGETLRALTAGIDACGELLRESGISAGNSDRNEIADDIRFE